MFKCFLSLILSLSMIFTTVNAKSLEDTKIYGESYVVIDGETNEVILGKNIDEKMYPASVSKLITAILLAENFSPTDTLVFTSKAKSMPEYSVNLNYYPLEVGQELSADFIMKSILIFSANDMAQTAADNISEKLGVPFETLMNNKLKELGLTNTYFTNGIGLHDDNHYSTAYDLALLLKGALKYDWIREVVGIKETTVTLPDGSLIIYENSNKLLGTLGMIGGKTGYTSKAGRTLVGAFEIDGKLYFASVLKSVYDSEDTFVFQDMYNIVDIAKDKEKTLLYKNGQQLESKVLFEYNLFGFFGPKKVVEVPVILKEDVYIYDDPYNLENMTMKVQLKDDINIFTNGNKPVGTLSINIKGHESSYDIGVNISKIIAKNLHIYLLALVLIIFIIVFIIILIIKLSRPKKSKRIWG